MKIPPNIIANADDLGLSNEINKAILVCYESGFINSTSLLTNTELFASTVLLIRQNPIIINIGVHVNLAEGKPVSFFERNEYLDSYGNWNISKINRKIGYLRTSDRAAFAKEIYAQIDKALAAEVPISHIDSHYHVHTLPCFYKLFFEAAKKYNLKLRLAQSYKENSFIKFAYRQYINQLFKTSNLAYSQRFETVKQYLKANRNDLETIEIMLHPKINDYGFLTDHYDEETIAEWIKYLDKDRDV